MINLEYDAGTRIRLEVSDEPGIWSVGTVELDSYGRKYIHCDDGIDYYPDHKDTVLLLGCDCAEDETSETKYQFISTDTRESALNIFMDMPVNELEKEVEMLYATYHMYLDNYMADSFVFAYIDSVFDIAKDALVGRLLCGMDMRCTCWCASRPLSPTGRL